MAGSHSCDDDLPTSGQRNSDAEVARRAQEDGLVEVVFPGPVTLEGSCRFVTDIIKLILYLRQQLPMTYDQLKRHQKINKQLIQVND